jgi:hypothetical protein
MHQLAGRDMKTLVYDTRTFFAEKFMPVIVFVKSEEKGDFNLNQLQT